MKSIMENDQSSNQRALPGGGLSRGMRTPACRAVNHLCVYEINLTTTKSKSCELRGSAFPPGAYIPKEGPKARKLRSESRK